MTGPGPTDTGTGRGREKGRVTTGETSLNTLSLQAAETGEDSSISSPTLLPERRRRRVGAEIILRRREKRTKLVLDTPALPRGPVALLAKSGKAGSGKLGRKKRKGKEHPPPRVVGLVIRLLIKKRKERKID